MSATNLDLPVLISPEQIRRREFVTIRRGYDPDQVRAYLDQLAHQMELMRSMQREAQAEAEAALRATAQPRVDPYEQLGTRVSSVIKEADHAAETIRSDAEDDAERLTREARIEADRIRTDAQGKAEEARARAETAVRMAREETDRTIAGLATRREALVSQLASMRERLIGVAEDLESAMEIKVTMPDLAEISELLSDHGKGGGVGNGASVWTEPPAADATLGEAVVAVEETVIVEDAEEEDAELIDPSYEELWGATDALELEMPEIPALDLDWGEDDEEGSEPQDADPTT
jgi:DivIVA domain-containing protein